MDEPAVTSVRFNVDGKQLISIGTDDVLEMERSQPLEFGARPLYFFRRNDKTFLVTHDYTYTLPKDGTGECVFDINSADIIKDHIALDPDFAKLPAAVSIGTTDNGQQFRIS